MENPEPFDCVELLYRGTQLRRELFKEMTVEQELAYWKERTDEMLRKQKELTDEQKIANAKARNEILGTDDEPAAEKEFDCVEFAHQASARRRALMSTMTKEEQRAYWKEQDAALRKEQEEVREKRRRGIPPLTDLSSPHPVGGRRP